MHDQNFEFPGVGFFVIQKGNNIYGQDICQVLNSMTDSSERTAYILMDKIKPCPVQNYLLRPGAALKLSTCLSELGIFGAYVR